jgi:hypothetical protein
MVSETVKHNILYVHIWLPQYMARKGLDAYVERYGFPQRLATG